MRRRHGRRRGRMKVLDATYLEDLEGRGRTLALRSHGEQVTVSVRAPNKQLGLLVGRRDLVDAAAPDLARILASEVELLTTYGEWLQDNGHLADSQPGDDRTLEELGEEFLQEQYARMVVNES